MSFLENRRRAGEEEGVAKRARKGRKLVEVFLRVLINSPLAEKASLLSFTDKLHLQLVLLLLLFSATYIKQLFQLALFRGGGCSSYRYMQSFKD